jgi:hypothetical protein
LIAIRALQNYKFDALDALTDLVTKRWIKTCEDVYTSTGKSSRSTMYKTLRKLPLVVSIRCKMGLAGPMAFTWIW